VRRVPREPAAAPDDYDVEGSATDIDDPPRRLP
jgi:hypothetical protein